MSTAFEIEFPGVTNEGTSVLRAAKATYYGEAADDTEDTGMEAAAYEWDGAVWVESWHEDVGLTTFWNCPDEPTAIRLADYIVRGGL